MDPYLALMGQTPTPQQQAAMAQALRGQAALGGRLAASSIAPVSAQGVQMQQQADETARGIGLASYRNKMLEQQQQAMEARVLQSAIAAQSKAAKGGEASQFSKISGGRADKLYSETEKAGTVLSLARAMPAAANSAGVPLLGSAKNFLATNAPILASDRMEKDADMWRQWNMEYNNILRHDLFGSALTATEASAWRAASVNPNMTPEQIERNMSVISRIIQYKAGKRATALMNEGRPPQWIYDNYVDVLPEEFWSDPEAWLGTTRALVAEFPESLPLNELSDEALSELIRSKRK